MTSLEDLIERDSITAAWFWVTSIDAGPYAENEQFDAVFVRETNSVVGGGYRERRTFYVQGIGTAQVDSRREHGGEIVHPDLAEVLAAAITEAHEAAQYSTFREWAEDCRDHNGTYGAALDDLDDWQTHRERWRHISAWLGDEQDEYVKAAQEYVAGH